MPALAKLKLTLSPVLRPSEWKLPSSAITEWIVSSPLVKVTVSPAAIVVVAGEKAKFVIVTVTSLAKAGVKPASVARAIPVARARVGAGRRKFMSVTCLIGGDKHGRPQASVVSVIARSARPTV